MKLEGLNWNELLGDSDLNKSFEKFNSLINKIYCECFPIKIKYLTKNRLSKRLSDATYKAKIGIL